MKKSTTTDSDLSCASNDAQALLKAQGTAQHYLDIAEVILLALDLDGAVTMINRKGCELLGYPQEKIVGKIFAEHFVPKEHRNKVQSLVTKLAAGKLVPVESHESPIRIRNGDERIIAWNNSVLTDDRGKVIGSLNSGQDITERKKALEALAQAHNELEARVALRTAELEKTTRQLQEEIVERQVTEQHLRQRTTAIEAAANGVIITDRNKVIQWVNPAFTSLTGYTAEEAIGQQVMSLLVSGELPQAFYENLWGTVNSGRVWRGEIINRRKDGSLYTEEMTMAPVRNEQGDIFSFIEIKHDISARKKAEEKLTQYAEELRSKNEEMEEDLSLAREVQQAFLPGHYPSFPASAPPEESTIQFHHLYNSSGAVGGDFFEIMALSDTRAGLFICDVMGHGVRSALITAILRGLIAKETEAAEDPGGFMTEMNRQFVKIFGPGAGGLFATASYAVADSTTGVLSYASAGHPNPLHGCRETGAVDILVPRKGSFGPALGLRENVTYQTHQVTLRPNDLVMLYTDGIFEAVDPEGKIYGEERLLDAVRERVNQAPGQIFDDLLANVRHFTGAETFEDDVCLLAMELVRLG